MARVSLKKSTTEQSLSRRFSPSKVKMGRQDDHAAENLTNSFDSADEMADVEEHANWPL